VTGQDGRVRPLRVGERGRGDVLGPRVQRVSDGVSRIHACSPGAGEDLVGPPAEQERVGALESLADERRGLVVEQWWGPPGALEFAAAVLLRRAGFAPGPYINPSMSLRHSVDRDVRDGRQFHGRSFLRAGVVVRYDQTACGPTLARLQLYPAKN